METGTSGAGGYFVDTVGMNEKMIANYIKNQREEDYTKDQISLKEFADPFTGERNK
jgi:putative transposase